MTAQRPLVALLTLLLAAPAGAESFASWSLKGDKAKKRGDMAEAVEDYTSALRLWLKKDGAKAKAKALSARGAAYEDQGEDEKALEDVEAALAVDGKDARLRHRRGKLLLKQGRTTEAITDFYKATKLDLHFKEAYFDRARAYELQGDAKFAREDYKTACNLKLKQACDIIRPPKAAKEKRKKGRALAKRPRGIDVPRKRHKFAYKLDFPACIETMDSCVESGLSFADCVAKAKLCEKGNTKGCCPQLCIRDFHRLSEGHGRSDAAAFRDVFAPKAACSRGLSLGKGSDTSIAGAKELEPGSTPDVPTDDAPEQPEPVEAPPPPPDDRPAEGD